MLSSKPALAIGALAVGFAAFGTIVYFAAPQQPILGSAPSALAATEQTEAQADPPILHASTIVELEPVIILGDLGPPTPVLALDR